jgi:hypothetical protein
MQSSGIDSNKILPNTLTGPKGGCNAGSLKYKCLLVMPEMM